MIVKDSKEENPDKKYALNETIHYTVKAHNVGNVTLTNINIVDEMTGAKWHIDSLAPGAWSEEFTTEYVVTEADVLAGEVLNVATGSAEAPKEAPDPTVDPGEEKDPTEDPDSHITLTKKSLGDKGHIYKLGEKVKYQITVRNVGNLTATDVKVEDKLTGDLFEVGTMAPGAEEILYTKEYTVTEQDILKGEVLNVATGSGKGPDGHDPIVDPGEEKDPTDDPVSHVTITKKSLGEEGHVYKLGETIHYEIKVQNVGNLTATNVKVVDKLTGDNWTIEALAPNEVKVFKAQYVVTEKDVLNGEVINVATGSGKGPDGHDPIIDPGEEKDPTDTPNPKLVINKVSDNPEKVYKAGEKILYTITAVNEGNLTLTNVHISDPLTGDNWTVDSLTPGASAEFRTEYLVTEADAKEGLVKNVATGTADNPSDKPTDVTPGTEENKVTKPDPKPVPGPVFYDLVISYRDAETGETLHPNYFVRLTAGTAYDVLSPEIEGYVTDMLRVTSGINGMPRHNVHVIVNYVKVEEPEPTVEPTEDDHYDLKPVEEEDVPLANNDLGNHRCCIMHFLLMLASMVVLGCYTSSCKKHQAKIFELRQEIDAEEKKKKSDEDDNV